MLGLCNVVMTSWSIVPCIIFRLSAVPLLADQRGIVMLSGGIKDGILSRSIDNQDLLVQSFLMLKKRFSYTLILVRSALCREEPLTIMQ